MEVIIRRLRPEDYEKLIALWEEAGLPYKAKGRDSRENIICELKRQTAIFLVAEMDGKLVGSVLGTHDGRKGWINRLAIHPEYRRRGIAKMLVSSVEEHFEALGIEIYAALIEAWNETSMTVFERLGYQKHEGIYYYSKRKHPEV
jgi:ribosomal protein S18 acetylase RimI-like enzyme